MKKALSILIIATLIPLLLVLYSCSRSKEKTLTIVDNIKIDKYSSLETVSQSLIGNLIFSPLLYQNNSKTAVHYVLTDEVKVLPGNKVIEVKIKDGIRFHDGKPLTSGDIISSIKRIKAESNNDALKRVDGEAIDRLRFRLTSDFPISDTNEVLSAITAFSPSSPNLFNGTGAFRFKQWLQNGVELEANNDYFEGRPKLERIIYLYEPDKRKRILSILQGQADLLAGLSPDVAGFLKKDQNLIVHEDSIGFYAALFFNNESPVFSDKRLRRAVSLAIDRESIIEKGLKGAGVGISSPFPSELLPSGLKTDSQRYVPHEAARILREAGWKDMDGDGILEKGGKTLKFVLYYSKDLEELDKVADIIGQQLFEVGIGIETAEIAIDEIEDILGNYDLVLYASSYDDHFNVRRWLSSSPSTVGGNLSRYGSREVDGLLEELRSKAAGEKKRIYGRVAEIFDEEVPAAFLYTPVFYNAVNRRFKGIDKLAYDVYSFYRIKDWETEGR